MPLRNSLRAVEDLSDLSHLDELVLDKRLGQRSSAKKNRRNRHVERQFLRTSLAHHLQLRQPCDGEVDELHDLDGQQVWESPARLIGTKS